MQRDPHASPWASRFLDDDGQPEPINVTPRDQRWLRERQLVRIAERDRHVRCLRKRSLNAVGSVLFGVVIQPLAWLGWLSAIGWGIAAAISAYEVVVAQAQSSITIVEDQ